jgi:glycosyltransferase involved in cell wall biosynthesis
MHVGVETVFRNVQEAAWRDAQLQIMSIPIASYRNDRFERLLPFLPKSTRSNLRYVAGTTSLLRSSDLSAVWTLLDIQLLPWMLTGGRKGNVPVIFSTDSTPLQLRAFGQHYGNWGGRSNVKFRVRDSLYRSFIKRTAAIQAYSSWAANSLRNDYGVSAEKIRIFPPGVDTNYWTPSRRPAATSLPRVIFVGGDFIRKGGDLLLDVFRQHLRGRAELDVVTRPGLVAPEAGVRVHSGLKPNDPRLVRLFQEAAVLAIPTRADCFSMAGIEAMATSLPVVTCPVGGVADLFTSTKEGFLVPPDDGSGLARALDAIVSDPHLRRKMGAAGRELAVRRYDARTNTRRLLNLAEEVMAR